LRSVPVDDAWDAVGAGEADPQAPLALCDGDSDERDADKPRVLSGQRLGRRSGSALLVGKEEGGL
jgi:hypothetical protein